jgi:hypothetical protein
VRRLGGDRAGEIRLTRFLRNPSVTPAEMAQTAAQATSGRCAGRRVLAIQDTTVVRSEGGGGLYLHAVVAVDADDGAILGLVDAQFLNRSEGRKAVRRAVPIERKESYRWLQGADSAGKICAQALRITVVADRESDIFEAFARRPAEVICWCARPRTAALRMVAGYLRKPMRWRRRHGPHSICRQSLAVGPARR